jgi:hypothetical protein
MNQAITQAFLSLNARHRASVDEILISPNLRSEFLELVRQSAGPANEEHVLRCLINLRKRSQLPRSR